MTQKTRPRSLPRCLLLWLARFSYLLVLLSPNLAGAQQPNNSTDTVLPPPRGDEPAPPGPPATLPNPGPFAPPPAPPVANPWDGWLFLTDWPAWPKNFFGDIEIDVLKPHLQAALIGSVPLSNGIVDSVHPPTAQVGWTAALRKEIGWFLPGNLGYFAFSYRGFADDGRQIVTALDGMPFALRSRLDVNQIAFDFGTLPYSFAPRWFLSGRLGMAAANVFFDNQANNARQGLDASSDFFGAGPHLRADVWREFNLLPGLALFFQPDLMVLVGRIQQHYRESEVLDGSTVGGSFFLRRTQTVPVLTLRTGLSYTPANLSQCRFMIGYEFEDWWDVGRVPQEASRGQFYTNGVFLRALVSY
jgi:hypothetical protein